MRSALAGVSPVPLFCGQNILKRMVHVFTLAMVSKRVYHPFVHILTPKLKTRDCIGEDVRLGSGGTERER